MTAPKPISGILDLPPYVGGRAHVAGVADVYKLSANENALGASPAALAALVASFAQATAPALYPDGHCTALRAALGKAHGLNPEQIICGTGSGDLLILLAHGYLQAGDTFLHSAHGFLLYELAGRSAGATPISIAEHNLTADIDAMCAAIADTTRMVFIANPNNPTGTMLDGDALARLHSGLRSDILLVIDEAYAEYVDDGSYPRGFDWVAQYDNVVVTRTFSKAYGLAGLRLGWCYCPPAIAEVLNRLRGPFNVSTPALVAGLAAVGDAAHMKATRAHNTQWRDWFIQQCGGIGLAVRPSHTNFILLEFDTPARAQAAEAYLCARGVIPRGLAAYGLAHALRLTIGTEAANRAAFAALRAFQETA